MLAAMGTPQQVALRCRIVLAAGRGIEAAMRQRWSQSQDSTAVRERFRKGLQVCGDSRPACRKARYGPERVKALWMQLCIEAERQTH